MEDIESNINTPTGAEESESASRILVAEDALPNQILMKAMLKKMGFGATVVSDGTEAVEKVLAEPFDLVFMDIRMPKMDGYEATKALRQAGSTVSIIALSAHDVSDEKAKCISAGFDDYLSKPIDYDILQQMIQRHLFPGGKDMQDKIDSVKTQVDDLSGLCAGGSKQAGESTECSDGSDVIDWNQLIGRIVEEDIAREVVPLCVVDNKERVEMLGKAVEEGNAEDVKSYAHAIKGSSANVGAKKLSEVAGKLEHMAHNGDLSQSEELLQKIRTEFAKLESFMSNPDWIDLAKQQTN